MDPRRCRGITNASMLWSETIIPTASGSTLALWSYKSFKLKWPVLQSRVIGGYSRCALKLCAAKTAKQYIFFEN